DHLQPPGGELTRPLHLAQPGDKATVWKVIWMNCRIERINAKGEPRACREHLGWGTIEPLEGQPHGRHHGTTILGAKQERKRFTKERGLLFLALQTQGDGELAAQRPEDGLTQSDTIGFRTTINIEPLKLLLDHGEDVAAITHAQGRIINSERDEIARIEL